jgi:CRP-like cAMP-binding protein
LRGSNGNEKVFDLIGPGDCFGEPSLYTDLPHLVTAEAIVDSAVLHVARADLLREIREAPDLALRVIRNLAQRIYRRTSDLKGYMLMSGTQRVICYLLHELARGQRTSVSISTLISAVPTLTGLLSPSRSPG